MRFSDITPCPIFPKLRLTCALERSLERVQRNLTKVKLSNIELSHTWSNALILNKFQ